MQHKVIEKRDSYLYHRRNDRTIITGMRLIQGSGRQSTRMQQAQMGTYMMLAIRSFNPSDPPEVKTNMQATMLTIKVPARTSHRR